VQTKKTHRPTKNRIGPVLKVDGLLVYMYRNFQ